MEITLLDIIAIMILIGSALIGLILISITLSFLSKDPSKRSANKEMVDRFWKDIDDIVSRKKSVKDIVNDDYWNK